MSNQRDDVFGMYSETIAIATGTTALIRPLPGQIGMILKYISGGSLAIIGATFGVTAPGGAVYSGTTFALNNLYTLGTSEILNVDMSGDIYIYNTGGATVVAGLLRTLDSRPFNIVTP